MLTHKNYFPKFIFLYFHQLTIGNMPLAFTTGGPLLDRRRIHLGNVTSGGPLEAHPWTAGGCYQKIAGAAISGPLASCV